LDWWNSLSQGLRDGIISTVGGGAVLAAALAIFKLSGKSLKAGVRKLVGVASNSSQAFQPQSQPPEIIVRVEARQPPGGIEEPRPGDTKPEPRPVAQGAIHVGDQAEGVVLTGSFDVFLSYSHTYVEWVEGLAARLEDEGDLRVWLDRWVLVPGQTWQREMADGLYKARACAVCIGAKTPTGWFEQEIQRALNRQAREESFRVIPVLLPDADTINVNDFLELRTWVDFRVESNRDYAFYLLTCGINGVAPGRWLPKQTVTGKPVNGIERKLGILRRLKQGQLIDDEISLEYQRKLLDLHLNDES